MQPQGAEFPLDMVVTAIEVGRSAKPVAAAMGNCFALFGRVGRKTCLLRACFVQRERRAVTIANDSRHGASPDGVCTRQTSCMSTACRRMKGLSIAIEI
jgi:hypothetical protein